VTRSRTPAQRAITANLRLLHIDRRKLLIIGPDPGDTPSSRS
jgi:hypothetical protein